MVGVLTSELGRSSFCSTIVLSNRYHNSTNNDLLYWGLDYPPLTAYHSLLMGKVANLIDPAYVKLHESRGFESHQHQFFMRMTVLISDSLIFVSALYMYVKWFGLSSRQKWVVFSLCCHPGLNLIDYGHFQYNCVSLGLTLWSVVFLMRSWHLSAAVSFSLALNFKQMELYHALPIFFYLLAYCHSYKTWLAKIVALTAVGSTTVAVFLGVWIPFLWTDTDPLQVVRRIFPVNRGVFEDYVANFWCALNVVVKIRNIFTTTVLGGLCMALTALAALPSGLHLYFRPRFPTLLVSLTNASMAFFLFSYHVHEKSILLPALPVSLLIPYRPRACIWFLCVAHFSMLPLYISDGVVLPAAIVFLLYFILAFFSVGFNRRCNHWMRLAFSLSAGGSTLLTLLSLTCTPPTSYPYLWTLLISLFSFGHFVAFFLYFLILQLCQDHTTPFHSLWMCLDHWITNTFFRTWDC